MVKHPGIMLHRAYHKYQQSGLRGLTSTLLNRLADRISMSSNGACQPPAGEIVLAPRLESPAYNLFQQMPHSILSRYVSIQGKRVLEIGGAQACISAHAFLGDGAASVTVTGLDHISTEAESTDQRLRVMQVDALELSKHFESCSFDIVYGLSILEHIPDPTVLVEEVYRVLKPGGLALFEGYPLWSSSLGHHLWIASFEGYYKDKTTASYLFNEFPNEASTNPVPDWGHLLMSEEQLKEYLHEQSLPLGDIDCVIHWIYHHSGLNRLTFAQLAKAYTTSRLVVLEANTQRIEVPEHILRQLREKHGEGNDFGTGGVVYVLAKPE
jgi:ubiquinone/menaquinone biosynthesis C-methylase UbiE